MTLIRGRCGRCGHETGQPEACSLCSGRLRELDHLDRELRPGLGFAPFALVRAFVGFFRAASHLLHRPEFVGRLQLPVAVNAVGFLAGTACAVLLATSVFAPWFAAPWPVFEDLRAANEGSGSLRLTLATTWLLGPTLLEVVTGGLLSPLSSGTELAIAGPKVAAAGDAATIASTFPRLRASARVFLIQLAVLPLAWLCVLTPWVGLPLAFLLGTAAAAVVWFEAPFARRGLGLGPRLRGLARNWPLAAGFGAAWQLAVAVPFLNLLALAPTAAIAAAALYFRFDKQERQGLSAR
jgi:hypothetical protein